MHKAARSKPLLMERLAEVPAIAFHDWDSLLPDNIDSPFYSSFLNQFDYFLNLDVFRIRDLCYILRISTKTYYKILPELEKMKNKSQNKENSNDEDDDDENENSSERGRPPNVYEDEEQALLEEIEKMQCLGDCLSPQQSRIWLENYIKEKGREITLDRFWWHRFKIKHHEVLNVIKVKSLEASRADISKEDINEYFDRLNDKIKRSRAPQLIINMDESGFIARPNKNTTKNCVCLRKCTVLPSFRDEPDGNHISIVAAVTLSGYALKPLLISTTEKPPSEVIDSAIGNQFLWFKTKKGYLNEEAMLFWADRILLPYVNYTRQYFPSENACPLLIFDGLKSHHTDKLKAFFEENSIEILTLPPHSSHILQCLDLCFFGIMKKHYKIAQSYLFTKDQKKARKIEKIIKAFYTACFPPIILAGWKASGIDISYTNGNIDKISLNRTRVIAKLINN